MLDTSDGMPTEQLWMSVPEAAALLGCSEHKSYELAKQGRFPTIRIDGRVIVPRRAFAQWWEREAGIEPEPASEPRQLARTH